MKPKLLCIGVALAAAGCVNSDTAPLYFGQEITVGVDVGQAATATAVPEFSLGFKQSNVAIVPTVIPKEHQLEPVANPREHDAGAKARIASFAESKSDGGAGAEDALSTFGSFGGDIDGQDTELAVFFATGVAAQKIAGGFACSVSEGKSDECVETSKPNGHE